MGGPSPIISPPNRCPRTSLAPEKEPGRGRGRSPGSGGRKRGHHRPRDCGRSRPVFPAPRPGDLGERGANRFGVPFDRLVRAGIEKVDLLPGDAPRPELPGILARSSRAYARLWGKPPTNRYRKRSAPRSTSAGTESLSSLAVVEPRPKLAGCDRRIGCGSVGKSEKRPEKIVNAPSMATPWTCPCGSVNNGDLTVEQIRLPGSQLIPRWWCLTKVR